MTPTIDTVNSEQSLIMNKLMLYHFGIEGINNMPKHIYVERYNELCGIMFDRAYLPNEEIEFNPNGYDVRWDNVNDEFKY